MAQQARWQARPGRIRGVAMPEFHFDRMYVDREAEEMLGYPQGWRYSIEGDDVSLEHISYREFQAWLRENGIRQRSLLWESASGMNIAGAEYAEFTTYAYPSAEALVRSLLGRALLLDQEHALMDAAREWLTEENCPRGGPNGMGGYLVPDELADRFREECWPEIKHLARR